MADEEHRDNTRVQATLKVTLYSYDAGQFMELYSANLARGGVFLRSPQPLAVGTQVRFEFALRGAAQPVIGEAIVVWNRPNDPQNPNQAPGMGVQFLKLSSESKTMLEQAVAEAQLTSETLVSPGIPDEWVAPSAPSSSPPSPGVSSQPQAPSVGAVTPPEAIFDVSEFLSDEQSIAKEAEVPLDLTEEALDLTEEVVSPPAEPLSALQQPTDTTGDAADSGDEQDSSSDMVALPLSFSVNDTVLGIDLGTSNSCVAVVHEGKPHIVAAEHGEHTIPSVVAYTKKGDILVGKPAKDHVLIDPTSTIFGAKRFVGRHFQSPVTNNLKNAFPYKVVPGEQGQAAIDVRGEVVNLEQISAHILSHLKLLGQEFVALEVNKAIITVPAYYNDNQRQAVKNAGQIAGLDVQRIVNEPTAAALAYGFNCGYKKKILVYDLGGGTFDVSVLELVGNSFKVLACGGDNFLGGEDFDKVIGDFVVTNYELQHELEISKEPVIRQRIKQAAEFAKRMLSEELQTKINIPYLKTVEDKGFNLQMALSREEINRITMHLVDRTFQICDETLESSGIKKEELDDIILVGGQTRMPVIQNRIKTHFGKPPHADINPDEVVAMGAALLAGSMDQLENLKLRDTTSISIGIALPGGRFKPVIKANTPVPVSKQYTIGTTKESYNIDVFQGEAPYVKDNEYLGTLIFSDLPVGEKGNIKMKIEFKMTEECILKVVASHPETGISEEALLVTYDTPMSVKDAVMEDQPADSSRIGEFS